MRAYELPEWKEGKPIRRKAWDVLSDHIVWDDETSVISNRTRYHCGFSGDVIYATDWEPYVEPEPPMKAGQVWEWAGTGFHMLLTADTTTGSLLATDLNTMKTELRLVREKDLNALLADSLEEYYAKKSAEVPF